MGAFSIWHLLVVLLVILVVFGAGKLPSVMGDMAKGVKAFKRGLSDEQSSADAKNAHPAETAAVGAVTGATASTAASAAADTAKDGATVSKQG